MSKGPVTFFDRLVDKYGLDEAIRLDQHRRMMWIADNYVPTPAQAEWLFDGSLTKMVAGGVRSGKSYSSVKQLDWILGKQGALVWILGPDYEQATMEFDYIMDAYRPIGLTSYVSRPKEGQCKAVIKDGATIETKSTDNLRKIAGKAPDFILLVEAGQHDEGSVEKAYERGLEKDAFILMTGTFEGANTWYEDTFKEFQIADNPIGGRSFSMPTWSNTVIFPEGKDDPKFKRAFYGIPYELYMERVAAVPYAMSGSVIRGLDRQTHCVPLEVNHDFPVYIATDPATHTYPVLFIQRFGRRVHVLDEIYRFDCITQDILPDVMNHELFPLVTAITMDQAGKQRQANRSVKSIWIEETGLPVKTRYVLEEDNIDSCNLRLKPDPVDGDPMLLFNSNKIKYRRRSRSKAGGILAEADLWRYPETRDKHYRNKPIDNNNDGWKALGYFLIQEFGPVVERRAAKRPKVKPRWFGKQLYYDGKHRVSAEEILRNRHETNRA